MWTTKEEQLKAYKSILFKDFRNLRYQKALVRFRDRFKLKSWKGWKK